MKLARSPGMREQRWAHLLCGPVSAEAAGMQERAAGDGPDLQSRIDALESEVAVLRSSVQQICRELGLSQPGQQQ